MLKRTILLLSLLAPAPALAQNYENGQDAYAQRDWEAAERLWTEESAGGSADALLGLGNIYDFGLLGPSDPERAFGLYRRAAIAGLSEAAFNIAVMYDAGVGTPEDSRAAAAWYSFAALGGNDRAAYNLGQLFADGVGVARNDQLAAHWFGVAARGVPAADAALAGLDPDAEADTALSAPAPLGAELFSNPGGTQARFAWQSDAAPAGARYRIDLIRLGSEAPSLLASQSTPGSAVAIDLPRPAADFAWRVSQVTPDGYAASGWQDREGASLASPPAGIVRFEYPADDRRAEGLALRLGGAMTRFGTLVDFEGVARDIESSGARYGFAQDAEFAADVAAFLPGAGPDGAALTPGPDMAPGEVRVALAFEDEG